MQEKNKFNLAYTEVIQEYANVGSGGMTNLRSGENGGGLNVGGKGMNMGPNQVTLLDILADIEKQKRKKNPDTPIIAYPLQNNIPDDLAELVAGMADITALFVQASHSPVIKEHEKGRKAIKKIVKKLKHAGDVVMSIKHNLDDLVVEH